MTVALVVGIVMVFLLQGTINRRVAAMAQQEQ